VQQPHDANAEQAILGRISKMVADEKALRDLLSAGAQDGESERDRLAAIERELDQCWDLLRQRRGLREFGRDADQAEVRSAKIVENYKG